MGFLSSSSVLNLNRKGFDCTIDMCVLNFYFFSFFYTLQYKQEWEPKEYVWNPFDIQRKTFQAWIFMCACACVKNKTINTAFIYYRWSVLEDGLIVVLVFVFGGRCRCDVSTTSVISASLTSQSIKWTRAVARDIFPVFCCVLWSLDHLSLTFYRLELSFHMQMIKGKEL